jgi:hypothetical protein
MKKMCFKCEKEKFRKDFYKHPEMADGLLGKCKECTKKDTNKNRADRIYYYREYDRKRGDLKHRVEARKKYSKTKAYRISAKAAGIKWKENNKHKRTAINAVNNAIRSGILKKFPCEVCGKKERIHGHHNDYNKPLEVIWLCHTHHMAIHKNIREKERVMNQF